MLLNDNILDIEKPDKIYLSILFRDKCPGIVLDPTVFSIKYSTSA